jgi:glycosyltransferase involved in cell wall biosynthesis
MDSLNMTKVKILLLSTTDFGGAGLAFLKKTEMYREKGADATLIVLNKYSDSDASVGVINARSFWGRQRVTLNHYYCKLLKLLAFGKSDKKYIMYDVQISLASAKKILSLYGQKPDVIQVGWVTDFVSTKTIKELQLLTGACVLYTMVDNAPIGGGCHYPWDCKGYAHDCFPCPALGPSNRRAQKTLAFKHKYITPDMTIIGTTNDMNRAQKSLLFRDCHTKVCITMQPNPYRFTKQEGRTFFDIPADRYVIFCGADSIQAERKGFKELIESLKVLKRKTDISNITIIVAGGVCGDFPSGYDVKMVGKLSFKDVFKAYACADLFLCPSLEDSGPMMINFAVMAYIPVVAFEMGITLDIIKHKENGYVAKWRDVNDFADGILFCISNKDGVLKELNSFNNQIMKDCQEKKSIWKYLGIE